MNERVIDVYAKHPGSFENVHYQLVDSYQDIETVRFGNVLCTSVSQTVNDMLADFDNIDEQALIEALSHYYYAHGESFDGLFIHPENMERWGAIRDWAVEYYDEG